MQLISLFIFVCLIPVSVNALELGVQTHFGHGRGDRESAFKWMKSAEMRSFRDEIYWENIELQRGVFEPNEQALNSLKAFNLTQCAGIYPLLTLSFGNPLYDGGSQPYTAEGVAAFATYAGWLAKQLKGKVKYFEVWNEWNIGVGTNPKASYGSPVDYVKLSSATYNAIKEVIPTAEVIVGALADDLDGWPWLTAAIKAGLLKSADGVSVHLYNHSMSPSLVGASEIVNRLRTLQTLLRASNVGKPVPIYVTETGWPTHIGQTGVSEQITAEQDARLMLEAHTIEDLAGIWWYALIDGGEDPKDQEDRFGLLRTSLKEKPAGCRLRSLAPFVKQSSLIQNVSNGNAQVLVFKGKDGRNLLAVWAGDDISDSTTYDIKIIGSFGNAKAFDHDCGDRVINGFQSQNSSTIQIKAGSYPTLIWVEGNANITGIVLQ